VTPLRVLHAHSGNIYGGVERTLVTLVQQRGLAPDVEWRFALTHAGRLSEELAANGAAPAVIGRARASRPWTVWAARAQLRALLARHPCDVAIVHSLWGLGLFGPTLRRAGLPVALWVHGTAPSPWWLTAWSRRVTPDLVIANSRYTASHLPECARGLPSEIVYPPRAPLRPREDRVELRRRLGASDGDVVLLSLARLEAGKGHGILLEALTALRGDWRLWIAGRATQPSEHAYEASLRADVATRGLRERVAFLGERTDIADLLHASDVFVQPNIAPEAFGQALVEAMASGTPVVAANNGATPELVGTGTALLVPTGDAAALAAAIQSLLDDGAARRTMGEAGRRAAAMVNDPAIVIPHLARVLHSAAS
jgi:glycosyltransferase involved in cell wall biosynthesis